MANLYHDVPTGSDDLSVVNALIEIPKGGTVKYEYNHKLGCLMVDRLLKTPIAYTFNYGDIPRTWNVGDNDPLDVLVLSRADFVPGSIVPSRVIGGLKMVDGGEDDYKVVAVADDKYYKHVQSVADLHPKEVEDVEYFMRHYKDVDGKKVELNGWDDAATAIARIRLCQADYAVKFGK